jgi:hypothetical protein
VEKMSNGGSRMVMGKLSGKEKDLKIWDRVIEGDGRVEKIWKKLGNGGWKFGGYYPV